MSGGVDSSVAAALLKEQGYDVIGVTMHIWESPDPCAGGRGCCGYPAIADARRVAHRLAIPHYVLDFRKDFQRLVIDDFCSEYARGRTPNPCLRCNQFLKFGLLPVKAEAFNADIVATGHYARAGREGARWLLKRSADRAKDQTYFLYSLTQRQLAHALFPLGNLTKPEVRATARRLGLVTAEKKESQEVCFAPKSTYPQFLTRRFPELARPGPILDTSGKVIGRHRGIIHFTIGQRRRIGIAAPRPYYVVAIDPARNAITVGGERDACGTDLTVGNLNFIGRPAFAVPSPFSLRPSPFRAGVQIRYQHPPAPALISPINDATVAVKFDTPQRAITPGQAAVFYDGDTVIGGGTIT
jgi:tRNA-specific 2-thiouridylase